MIKALTTENVERTRTFIRWVPRVPRGFRHSGFTLVEMIVVIVILGIIATVGALIMSRGFSAYLGGKEISLSEWQGRVALERMTRELHDVRSPADLTTITAGTLTFNDISGTAITYTLSGGSITRNGTALADNITALTFIYLDQAGAVTAVAANVYYISVALTASTTGPTVSANVNYRDTVKPRNF